MVGIRPGRNPLAILFALAIAPLSGQTLLSLEEVGARDSSADYPPSHLNQRVIVRGVVNSSAFHFSDHTLLAIDDGNFGAILRVPRDDARLDPFHVGDEIQVEGAVAMFFGMPVVQPEAISKLGVKPAPAPVEVPLDGLIG